MNNSDLNNLLSQLSPPKCDNSFTKRISAGNNNFNQDYNKLSENIINFNNNVHSKKEDNNINDRLNNLRSFDNQEVFNQKPYGNISCLNRNFFLDNQQSDEINDRMRQYEPIPKNSNNNVDRNCNYELSKNNYKDEYNQRLSKIDDSTKNSIKINNKTFDTMIFSSKKNDNNERFQNYTPLPRNLQYSLNNNNKMNTEQLLPSNTRCNYDFNH